MCKAWKCLRNYVLVHECGSGRQKCSMSAFTAIPGQDLAKGETKVQGDSGQARISSNS